MKLNISCILSRSRFCVFSVLECLLYIMLFYASDALCYSRLAVVYVIPCFMCVWCSMCIVLCFLCIIFSYASRALCHPTIPVYHVILRFQCIMYVFLCIMLFCCTSCCSMLLTCPMLSVYNIILCFLCITVYAMTESIKHNTQKVLNNMTH